MRYDFETIRIYGDTENTKYDCIFLRGLGGYFIESGTSSVCKSMCQSKLDFYPWNCYLI